MKAMFAPAVTHMILPSPSRYIELLKRVLIGYDRIGSYDLHPLDIVQPNWRTAFLFPLDRLLRVRNFAICKREPVVAEKRLLGMDWPADALTMIGMARLNNLETCIRTIHEEGVPGDLLEAGVWRGGAAIFMRAMLQELDVKDRTVWLADSFAGLPPPDPATFPADRGNTLHTLKILRVGSDEVRSNFRKYDLLDEQVKFLEGWFEDTLPSAPISELALLRLDGDMYGSTIVALAALYPKVTTGGFVVVDDYHAFPACKKAVDHYRSEQGITDDIIAIDNESVYWRRRS